MSNELAAVVRNRNRTEFLRNAKTLGDMLRATTKKVTVEISDTELSNLKDSGYSLCFAKKVGDFDYDVIWKSFEKYLSNNIFVWQPLYQIFGTNTFADSIQVTASTKVKTIGLGEIAVLDGSGILHDPFTGGDEAAINVDNEYGDIHFAISQMSVNDKGEMQSTPIYVTKGNSIIGKDKFVPVEKVQVCFQYQAKTSTMFADLRSNSIEIDLTDDDDVTVYYEDGKWAKK